MRRYPGRAYTFVAIHQSYLDSPTMRTAAALHAANSDALYFVLRPDGSSGRQFSSTIAAHEAATAKYRRSLEW